jgi:hypothetical protein
MPGAELREHLGQGERLAPRTRRDQVGDLARDAGVSPAHLAVADYRAAQALAEVGVGEIVEAGGRAGRPLGPGRPVDVVVDDHRPADVRREQLSRGQLAQQERGVGQVNEPAGRAVNRVGVRAAFAAGSSPGDFPDENYERTWANRFTEADLNAVGRRGLNLG